MNPAGYGSGIESQNRFSTTDEVVEELARIGRTLDLRLARYADPDGSG
ncbi:MAG: hypothetical protein QME96_07900 [Myxococcota bacterium]|nr:hypothetical protein [Myxococcota bacterium]